MSEQTTQGDREEHEKSLTALSSVVCESCDLAGNLTILNDFLQECDPLDRDKEEFYMVFRGIQQTVASAVESAKKINMIAREVT